MYVYMYVHALCLSGKAPPLNLNQNLNAVFNANSRAEKHKAGISKVNQQTCDTGSLKQSCLTLLHQNDFLWRGKNAT